MMFLQVLRFHQMFESKCSRKGRQNSTAKMLSLVDDAEKVLTDKTVDLDEFGRMLDHTWKLKDKLEMQFLQAI